MPPFNLRPSPRSTSPVLLLMAPLSLSLSLSVPLSLPLSRSLMGAAGLLDGLPPTVSCVVFSSDGVSRHYRRKGRLPFHGECAHGKNPVDSAGHALAKRAMLWFEMPQRVEANETTSSFLNCCLLAHATPPATRTQHPTARTSLAQASVHPVHPHLLDHRNLRKQLADPSAAAPPLRTRLQSIFWGAANAEWSTGQERFSQASRSPLCT